MSNIPPSSRTTIKRLPERGVFDRKAVNAILDEAVLCHLAIIHDGYPVVTPTLFGRDGHDLALHGSPASRTLRAAAGSVDVSVNVTLVDAIVVARSAFHSSMNYRSVTIFGRAEKVTDPAEKRRLLGVVVEHVIPGRTQTARPMTDAEVKATTVLRLPITEASAKVRTGWPGDDEADYDLPVWAGVIPITTQFGAPVPDPVLPPHVLPPGHLLDYRRPAP